MAHSMFSADALPRGEKKMKRAGGGWAGLGQSMSVSAASALAGGITVGTGSHVRATTHGGLWQRKMHKFSTTCIFQCPPSLRAMVGVPFGFSSDSSPPSPLLCDTRAGVPIKAASRRPTAGNLVQLFRARLIKLRSAAPVRWPRRGATSHELRAWLVELRRPHAPQSLLFQRPAVAAGER